MGKEKKKWYQTGEFEDGYQFGDVFRTVKNAVKEYKEEKSANKKEKSKSNDNKSQTSKTNNRLKNSTFVNDIKNSLNSFADDYNLTDSNGEKTNDKSFTSVNDGKLGFDEIIRSYGFMSEEDRKNYIKENPNLYAVMGGYKYEPNVLAWNHTPLSEKDKSIVAEAQQKDAYINSLQYKIDRVDAFKAQEKRSKGISLSDREIEAEVSFDWINGKIKSDEIAANINKSKEINDVLSRFYNGEEINLKERLILTENGGANFTNNDTYKIIDFLAEDNPENKAAYDDYIKAIEKQKNGEELSNQEKADISNYIAREEIKKSIIRTEDYNTVLAVDLYNDAIYEKGINKTLAQMELYVNTGITKYMQDTINTFSILSTEAAYGLGLGDKRGSDVIKNTPKNKFEIANDTVAQNFSINNKEFSKFVQDTTVSLSNNVIPALLGGVSAGASVVATGLSSFGSSYSEAVRLAPEAEEWRYWGYSVINAATEVYMSKVLSGDKNIFANSGSDFSEAMFKTLTKNVSNKTLLKGAYVLSNSTGESLEEGIQGLLSPVLQKTILGANVTSILSSDYSEQRQAVKNAMYDGLIGFASAGITTGLLGRNAVQSIEQKQTVGAYYKKILGDLNVDIENVAVYLKEISGENNIELYKSAEKILNGDKSNDAVADMMLNGFEKSREAQKYVYTKIGEQLNQNNRYTVYEVIRQYNKLNQEGVQFSESVKDAYDELVNGDEDISRDRFNYLVGRLSTTMDAELPRVAVSNEVIKKINTEIKDDGLSNDSVTQNDNKDFSIDEDAFIDGLWDDGKKREFNTNEENVEISQLESVENIDESGIIEENIRELTLDDLTRDVLKTKPPYSPNPKRWIKKEGSIAIDKNGNWIYTDCDGITVKYVDGYPDFESAGTVEQKVNIGEFKNRASDAKRANALAPNGPRKKDSVWHHSPDGKTMMEISESIHRKFTHRGGYALMKIKRRE